MPPRCLIAAVGVFLCAFPVVSPTGCGTNQFKAGAGDGVCQQCPAFSTSAPGSTSHQNCTCNAGFTQPMACLEPSLGGAHPPVYVTEAASCESGKHIQAGSVLVIPSGPLSMRISWSVCPGHDIASVTIYIKNCRNLFSCDSHKFVDAPLSGMEVGYWNKNDFVPGNDITYGNFPGFQLGLKYRAYIQTFSEDGTALSRLWESSAFSQRSLPIIQASPPLLVQSCGPTERTPPCNEFDEEANTLRIHWERPDSSGYGDTDVPADAYQIEYYRVEVATDDAFACLVASATCRTGQIDEICVFDERIFKIGWLLAKIPYSVRIFAGTLIGDGDKSTLYTSANVTGQPGPPDVTGINAIESEGMLDFVFTFGNPTDRGDGLETMPIIEHNMEVSATAEFSVILNSKTMNDGNMPGGCCSQDSYEWAFAITDLWKTHTFLFFFRVRSTNAFGLGEWAVAVLHRDGTHSVLPHGGSATSSMCFACQQGTFQSAPGSAGCEQCPLLRTSVPGSTAGSACQCVAGFSDPSGETSACQECPAGTYKNDTGGACDSCPANSQSVQGSTHKTSCKCNAGWTGADRSADAHCTMCEAGEYSTVSSEGCQRCPGNYTSPVGSNDIGACHLSCPAHSSSPAGSDSIAACVCDAGHSGPDGGTCSACPVNTYKATALSYDTNYARACGVAQNETCGTTQSHTHIFDSVALVSAFAVDGLLGQNMDFFSSDRCTSTRWDKPSWWRVDLGKVVSVSDLDIYGRSNSHMPSGTDAHYIYVRNVDSLSSIREEEICVSNQLRLGKSGPTLRTCTQPINGRFVFFWVAGSYMNLCEVQVRSRACGMCPAHSSSPEGSERATACTCDAGYSGPDGGPCAACVSGTYKDGPGSAACGVCGDNMYSYGGQVHNDCLYCPLGSTSTSGSKSVFDCNCVDGQIKDTFTEIRINHMCVEALNGVCMKDGKWVTVQTKTESQNNLGCGIANKSDCIMSNYLGNHTLGWVSGPGAPGVCFIVEEKSVTYEMFASKQTECVKMVSGMEPGADVKLVYRWNDCVPPAPTTAGVFEVTLAVSLPMTMAAFDESTKNDFRAGIAAAAAVSAADVRIVSVASLQGRRLLTARIRVETAVTAADAKKAKIISAGLTAGRITSKLSESGMPAVDILELPKTVTIRKTVAIRGETGHRLHCAFLAAEEERELLFALELDTWTKSDEDDVSTVVDVYEDLSESKKTAVSAACQKHFADAAIRLGKSPAGRLPAAPVLAALAALASFLYVYVDI